MCHSLCSRARLYGASGFKFSGSDGRPKAASRNSPTMLEARPISRIRHISKFDAEACLSLLSFTNFMGTGAIFVKLPAGEVDEVDGGAGYPGTAQCSRMFAVTLGVDERLP